MNTNTARRRVEEGLCVLCGKPNGNGHQRCDVCAKAQREYQLKRYYELLKQHRCSHCGKPMSDNWYYVTCETCKTKADNTRWAKKGVLNGTADRPAV